MFESITGKIKEIREGNINRRESIARVKAAIKAQKSGSSVESMDNEAVIFSKKYNVSYNDAIEYLKSEKKAAQRKESLKGIASLMSEVGQNAKKDTARRYGNDQFTGGAKINQPSNNDSSEMQKMNNMAAQMKQKKREMLGMN